MNVCNVVLRLAARAGLQDRVGGTHVLRHSLASRMLGAGATLKQIADLLGHTTVDTTSIYAKVDLRTLSRVALPWPGSKAVRQ
jgi:site-specific recombinase XerD